jgi:uncharacterized protein YkwD
MHATLVSADDATKLGTRNPTAIQARERTAPWRRRTLACAMTGAVLATGALAFSSSAAQPGSNVPAFLAHLNQLRAAHGLRALALAADLDQIAQSHSQEMAAQGTVSHNPNLTTQAQNWQTLGENVGMGPTPAAIDNAFDHSPDHYANEVNATYTQVGIGTYTASNGEIYVTLDFREPS